MFPYELRAFHQLRESSIILESDDLYDSYYKVCYHGDMKVRSRNWGIDKIGTMYSKHGIKLKI